MMFCLNFIHLRHPVKIVKQLKKEQKIKMKSYATRMNQCQTIGMMSTDMQCLLQPPQQPAIDMVPYSKMDIVGI